MIFVRNVGDYFNQFRNAIEASIFKTIDLGKGWESVGGVATNALASIIQNIITARTQTQLYLSVVNTLKGALAGLAVAFAVDLINKIQNYFAFTGKEFQDQLLDIQKIYDLQLKAADIRFDLLDITEEEAMLREKYKNNEISIFEFGKRMLDMNKLRLRALRQEFELQEEIRKSQLKRAEEELRMAIEERDMERTKQLTQQINELKLRGIEEEKQFRESRQRLEEARKQISEFIQNEIKRIADLRSKVLGFIGDVGGDLSKRLRDAIELPKRLREEFGDALIYLSAIERRAFDRRVVGEQGKAINAIFEDLAKNIDDVQTNLLGANRYFRELANYDMSIQKLNDLLFSINDALKQGFSQEINQRLQQTKENILGLITALEQAREARLSAIFSEEIAGSLEKFVTYMKDYANALSLAGNNELEFIKTVKASAELESVIRNNRLLALKAELELRKKTLEEAIKTITDKEVRATAIEYRDIIQDQVSLLDELIKKEREVADFRIKQAVDTAFEEQSKKRIAEINERFEQAKKAAESFYIFTEDREKALQALERKRLQEVVDFYKNLQQQRELTKNENKQLLDAISELNKINSQAVENTIKTIEDGLQKSLQVVDNTIDKLMEIQMQSMDAIANSIERDLDFYKAMVEKGNLAAFETYAKLMEQERQLRRELAEERRATVRREAILSLLKAFSSLVMSTNNAPSALSSTINALASIASSVDRLGLHRGTEYVKEKHGIPINRAIDGILVRLHIGERVIPAEMNQKVAHMSNEQLIQKAINSEETVKYDYDHFERALVKIISKPGRTIIARRYG